MDKLSEQIRMLLNIQRGLTIVEENKYSFILKGYVKINAEYRKIQLIDNFLVKIIIFKDFPTHIPIVYELEGKIEKDFEHVNEDKSLCLAVNTEMKLFLDLSNSLIEWFNKYVVNYFYSVMYYRRYRIYPFGERSHGIKGVVEFYKSYLNLDDVNKIINVLNYVRYRKIKHYEKCPCGSNKKIKKCHINQLEQIARIKENDEFLKDIKSLMLNNKIIMGYSNEKILDMI